MIVGFVLQRENYFSFFQILPLKFLIHFIVKNIMLLIY